MSFDYGQRSSVCQIPQSRFCCGRADHAREPLPNIGTIAAVAIASARKLRRLATFFGVKVCDITSSYIGADLMITFVTSAATALWYFINRNIQQTNLIVV